MRLKWQRIGDEQAEPAEDYYPRFEAWQPRNPVDDCWCLTVKRSASDQDPIRVLALPSPEAVEEFVEGWLQGSVYNSSDNLPLTIHFSTQEMQASSATESPAIPSRSLAVRESTDRASARKRIFYPPQTA